MQLHVKIRPPARGIGARFQLVDVPLLVFCVVPMDNGRKGVPGQVRAVCDEDAGREQQCKEPLVVATAEAVVDPDAVVIHAGDARLAYAAVLAAWGLREPAGGAHEAGVVQHAIVGVVAHLLGMVVGSDVRLAVVARTQIQEQVRLGDEEEGAELMAEVEQEPDGGQDHAGAGSDKAEEEDDDDRVLVVHEVVAQTGAATRDTAIGEDAVESCEGRGQVEDKQAVEEANGRVSRPVSMSMHELGGKRMLCT